MKKILVATLLALTAVTASAHGGWRHGGGHYVYRDNWGWVVPAVIGGVIVYEATRPPVVVQQPVPVYPPVSSPPYPPYGYHYEQIADAGCNCYRWVLVPN